MKKTKKAWVNVYDDGMGDYLYSSKEEADKYATSYRKGCKEVTVEWEE